MCLRRLHRGKHIGHAHRKPPLLHQETELAEPVAGEPVLGHPHVADDDVRAAGEELTPRSPGLRMVAIWPPGRIARSTRAPRRAVSTTASTPSGRISRI